MLREDQLDPDDPGPESGSGFSHLHLSYLTDNKLNSSIWILLKLALKFVIHDLFDTEKIKPGVISQTVTLGPYLSSVSE